MTTKDVAKKWAEYCRTGKNMACIESLYDNDIKSYEMTDVPNEHIEGKKNVLAKSKKWLDSVVVFHSGYISEPVVIGNHFTSIMEYDVTFDDGNRYQMEEIAVFEVNEGKIVREQFFYKV